MAVRVGVTKNLQESKWHLEKSFKNTRQWKSTKEFKNKEEAFLWLETKAKELNCKTVNLPKTKGRFWFGLYFEHDGPK